MENTFKKNSEKMNKWIEEIHIEKLMKYKLYGLDDKGVKITQSSDIKWIYNEWDKVIKSRIKPKFLLERMHTWIVLKSFIYSFLPFLIILSIIQTPMLIIGIPNFNMFFISVLLSGIIGITAGWTASISFYKVQLKSYKIENILKEKYLKNHKFEPNFWNTLGSILLTKDKSMTIRDIRDIIKTSPKGLRDNLKMWSKKSFIHVDEEKNVFINEIEININRNGYGYSVDDEKKMRDEIKNLIYIRCIIEATMHG